MIPPVDYDIDIDRADILITVGIDRTIDGEEEQDTFYQMHLRDKEEFTGLSPGELMHVISSLNAVGSSILHGWLHHLFSEGEEDRDFKIDEDLE